MLNTNCDWATSKRFSGFNGTRPTQAIGPPQKKKVENNLCVLNYYCRLTSIIFPFLTPLEHHICAHSLELPLHTGKAKEQHLNF